MNRPHVLVLAALSAVAPAQSIIGQTVVSGLSQPVGYHSGPAGAPNFVLEKAGRLRTIQGGVATTVLDRSGTIDSSGERGFLGLAHSPDFATTGRVYLSYVDPVSKGLVVARLNAGNGYDWNSREAIIEVPHPTNRSNHNGGNIRFGNDGLLYIGTGDGGGSNDPENRAQNLNDNLGKILRVDVSGSGSGYGVPASNPFVGVAGNDEIYHYGLRNPWRFDFDRADGSLYVADVGQGEREEVNLSVAGQGGLNFGWRAREGTIDNPGVGDAPPAGASDPLFDYDHNFGQSITGGTVYRGTALGAAFQGRYFFADFSSGGLFSVDPTDANPLSTLETHTSALGGNATQIVSIDQDRFGELYVTSFNGSVTRLVPEPASLAVLGLGLSAVRRRRRG